MPVIKIAQQWNFTARQVGYVMIGGGVLNGMWMGTTRQEVVEAIVEINSRREKLGLDALNWQW